MGEGKEGSLQRLKLDYNDIVSFLRYQGQQVQDLKSEIKELRAEKDKDIKEASDKIGILNKRADKVKSRVLHSVVL